jgi:putative CocE/NonD family hydrolase
LGFEPPRGRLTASGRGGGGTPAIRVALGARRRGVVVDAELGSCVPQPGLRAWETSPLTEDVTIAGDVTAHLCASTTGTDADWVVKLIDVYPDSVTENRPMGGYELMVAEDIMRGRYRTSFEHPAPIPPNTVEPFTVDLHEQLYRFLKGHRIMVQVQSSWFPLYDRNPQTYVPNIFEARASDFHAREHRVYHNSACASRISLGVLP